jgi:cation diffusion facilitator family transporter
MSSSRLRRLALLSVAAAVLNIGLKAAAYAVTGSAGLLSDALESAVNLLAAGTAYLSLLYAARPADASHAFGHEKIEFFAAGLEGVLILFAAGGIGWYALDRLVAPRPIEAIGLGAGMALAASAVNLVVARVLLRVGRANRSVVLEADGQHLMADVYTSAAVVTGLGLVAATGLTWLDPLLALAVGLHIGWTGVGLIRRSYDGLMDHALPAAEVDRLRERIRAALPAGADFHALRTRQAGSRTVAEFHLLVPGDMTVREAHAIADRIEDDLRADGSAVTIHVEPIDDRRSWEEAELLRLGERATPADAGGGADAAR